jgi:transposase
MKRTKLLEEIRIMKFEEVYEWWNVEKRLNMEEAAALLGICERTFRRWCERYEEEGMEGLYDKRLGKMANNAAPVDEVTKMLGLYETKYCNFTVSHFYEKWKYEHGGERSYTWVKNQLQRNELIKKAKKRGAHRRKRPRCPMIGMMLHQDGSSHEWVADQKWDLIITMDDATNKIYSGFFVKEEGTWSSFRGVKEVIKKYGIFCSLYTDRGTHYWKTSEEGGKVDKHNLTQFGRAMSQIGIEMIPAYSPEARGRSERMFKTLQGRLPKELALEGITKIEEANNFLEKKFLPAFNKRFAVKAEDEESVFVPWVSDIKLEDILCIHEERMVGKDNTVNYYNKQLQIPKDRVRYNYFRTQVKVHEYANRKLAVFYGRRCLGRYDENGQLEWPIKIVDKSQEVERNNHAKMVSKSA